MPRLVKACAATENSATSGHSRPSRVLSVLAAIRDRWQGLAEQDMGGLDISAARHGFGQAATTDR